MDEARIKVPWQSLNVEQNEVRDFLKCVLISFPDSLR